MFRAAGILSILALVAADDLSPYSVKFDIQNNGQVQSFFVDVNPAWSPNGAQRFHDLVSAKFYDNTRFFRVIPGFMAQFGMAANPADNEKWGNIPDDHNLGVHQQSNERGFVSFAKTGAPNSRTTQLFINYGNNANLDSMGFTPFGKVRTAEGMHSVDNIYKIQEHPSQSHIKLEGNRYMDANFPEASKIVSVSLV